MLFSKYRLPFFLMLGISCLLNINYAILRSARNALAVADLGGGASSIPWFELCGTMPGAFLMTLCLTYLLNRHTIRRVFFMVLTFFVLFFLAFAIFAYPIIVSWEQGICSVIASMLFFVMAELWKIALLTVLFWGLVNQYVPLEQAKKYYAPLMLGGSVGTILAGPLISLATSSWISQISWGKSFAILMWMVFFVSVATAYFFQKRRT
jgi:AAA family ATP:ADP antiporter